jgi:hypothetical protein
MQQPVEDAGGGGAFGQETSPLLERPMAGDGQGSALVAGGDEPEQQLGAGVVERGEANFVDDDKVCAEQGVDDLACGQDRTAARSSEPIRPPTAGCTRTHPDALHRLPKLNSRVRLPSSVPR